MIRSILARLCEPCERTSRVAPLARYDGFMRTITDIDVLSDAALQARVTRWSGALLVAGLMLAVVAATIVDASPHDLVNPWWWIALAGGSLAALPVHELVHAMAFKLACPGCRVSFGHQDAFLYTKTDGACGSRARMVCVLLAPAVVVTAVLAALALAADRPVLAVLLAFAHLSGCSGDLLMAREVLRESACTHVRDTEFGITLLSDIDSNHEEAS